MNHFQKKIQTKTIMLHTKETLLIFVVIGLKACFANAQCKTIEGKIDTYDTECYEGKINN